MPVHTLDDCNKWWNGLKTDEKQDIVDHESEDDAELRYYKNTGMTQDGWWTGKNWSIRSKIYQRYMNVYRVVPASRSKKNNKSR
jgi:hypothetical protein